MCILILMEALLTILETWKQPKCLSVDESMRKMCCMYAMEYYLSIKNNEILGCVCLFELWFCQEIYPGVELSGHKVVLFLIFLRDLHTILHNDCNNLHPHQQCRRDSFSPYPLHRLFYIYI